MPDRRGRRRPRPGPPPRRWVDAAAGRSGRSVLTRPEPLAPAALADRLAALLADVPPEPGAAALRVAVDGPDVAEPGALADALAERLPALGRGCAVVRAEGFYRPASLRLEHGRTDPDARYSDWLDAGALTREVLARVGPDGDGSYLPVLWDLDRDRAVRADRRPAPPAGVLVVAGALLQGIGLPFDVTVHLKVSPAARARRTPPERAWELPAFDRYDAEVAPADLADAVVLADSPERPALVLAGRFAG